MEPHVTKFLPSVVTRVNVYSMRDTTAEQIAERFWRKVKKGDGCWLWVGARRTGERSYKEAYGNVWLVKNGRATGTSAHRISWELHNGPAPSHMQVCHRCDNPPCVRPDHLFLGTRQDNARDMVAKGRHRGPYSRKEAR